MRDSVEVRLTAAGVPLRFRWRGRIYRLGAEPVRWFERRPWWAEQARMSRGHGVGVELLVWRVQARLAGNPRAELLTFELSYEPDTDAWWVRKVDERLSRAG